MSIQNKSGSDIEIKQVLASAAVGAAAGLVASFVMTEFQTALSKWLNKAPAAEDPEEKDATIRAANVISEKVFHKKLTEKQEKVGGPLMHYGFGTLLGSLYGALNEALPSSGKGLGLPYGAAVWLGADEIGVPLARLSKNPTEYPLEVHLQALLSHLVYGAATHLVYQGIQAIRGDREDASAEGFKTPADSAPQPDIPRSIH